MLNWHLVVECPEQVEVYRCFDLVVWPPSQGACREISLASHFSGLQTRRMKLHYRPSLGCPHLCHTLTGSGLAVGRALVAIPKN